MPRRFYTLIYSVMRVIILRIQYESVYIGSILLVNGSKNLKPPSYREIILMRHAWIKIWNLSARTYDCSFVTYVYDFTSCVSSLLLLMEGLENKILNIFLRKSCIDNSLWNRKDHSICYANDYTLDFRVFTRLVVDKLYTSLNVLLCLKMWQLNRHQIL